MLPQVTARKELAGKQAACFCFPFQELGPPLTQVPPSTWPQLLCAPLHSLWTTSPFSRLPDAPLCPPLQGLLRPTQPAAHWASAQLPTGPKPHICQVSFCKCCSSYSVLVNSMTLAPWLITPLSAPPPPQFNFSSSPFKAAC